MANITITVQSLLNTAVYNSYTIDNGQTINQLKTAINTARGFNSTWYDIVQNEHIVSGTATLSSLGITTGTQLRTHNKIARLATRELRQKAKLNLAALDRASTSETRTKYDITQLPTQYVGNDVVNNLQEGSLKLGRPWITFLPNDLFLAGEKGVWYDPNDITTLFQDSAGTIPVTAFGQPVGKVLDKSGNNIHATQSTSANRPIYSVHSNGFPYLQFDGVNDSLVTSTLNLTTTDKVTWSAGLYVGSAATGAVAMEFSANTNTNAGTFYISAPSSVLDHGFGLRGNSASPVFAVVSNVYINNQNSDIATGILDIGKATKELELIPRLNQTTITNINWSGAANAGTGNFGSYPLYLGARGGTTAFFNGHVYQVIIRGKTSTTDEIYKTERYIIDRMP
jgi:hypothetical protein